MRLERGTVLRCCFGTELDSGLVTGTRVGLWFVQGRSRVGIRWDWSWYTVGQAWCKVDLGFAKGRFGLGTCGVMALSSSVYGGYVGC